MIVTLRYPLTSLKGSGMVACDDLMGISGLL